MWQTDFRQRLTGKYDVISVADVDAAVCIGPGLRWALMGPNLIYHLGGGLGGIRHFFEQFAGSITVSWANLGSPTCRKRLWTACWRRSMAARSKALSQERDNFG